MRNEVLASAGISTRERHSDSTAFIALAVHLVANRIAGPAISIIPWIPILRHKIRHHSVKARVPIVSRPREGEKVPYRNRRFGAEQLQPNRPAHGVDGGVDGFPESTGATIIRTNS